MSAAHFNLDNLIAIVDNNGFQNDGDSEGILSAGDIGNKWNSFGWNVCPVDGHDISKLYNVLVGYMVENKPKVVIANTIKGKGVSFMENNNEWHHNRLTEALYKQGLQEMVNG